MKLPFMFGLLGSSQKLLYVLSDLLCLTDDVLCAWQGGIFLTLLPWLPCFRGWKGAAANEKKQMLYHGLLLYASQLIETRVYILYLNY